MEHYKGTNKPKSTGLNVIITLTICGLVWHGGMKLNKERIYLKQTPIYTYWKGNTPLPKFKYRYKLDLNRKVYKNPFIKDE